MVLKNLRLKKNDKSDTRYYSISEKIILKNQIINDDYIFKTFGVSSFSELSQVFAISDEVTERYILDGQRGKISKESYEIELRDRFISGEKVVFNYFYHVYRPMIKKIIHSRFKYLLVRYGYEDIEQVGAIGIMKAITKFDEFKETKFSTHIYNCIKFEIMNYYRDWELMKFPRSKKKICVYYMQQKEKYEKLTGEVFDISDAAFEFGIGSDDLKKLVDEYQRILDIQCIDSLEDNLNFVYSDLENDVLDKCYIEEVFNKLGSKYAEFIKMRFIEGYSRSELMKKYNLNEKEYSKVMYRAKECLKKIFRNQKFLDKLFENESYEK